MTDYTLLQQAREAFQQGKNITAQLRRSRQSEINTDEIIELAYHLQAGSYAQKALKMPRALDEYCSDLSVFLGERAAEVTTVLDIGTGEMTVFSGMARHAFGAGHRLYAMDISLKRLLAGRTYLAETDAGNEITPLVGNLFQLPFVDNAVDLVISTHAIEPNGGREAAAINEVFRVARKYVLFAEPSYANNSPEGRKRMESLGYIGELADAIDQNGGTIEESRKIGSENYLQQPLNPTWGYLCRPPEPTGSDEGITGFFACPLSKQPLQDYPDHLFCPHSGLAYPKVDSIPVLRAENAIIKD